MSELKITKENFKNLVLENPKPVVLDFYADWCGPCKMLAPQLSALAEKYSEKIAVAKINVDEEPELAAAHGIESIPTLALYEKGKAVKATLGYKTMEDLEKWLEL